MKIQGLRDDTTCLVVDIVPPGRASRFFAPAVRKHMTVMKFLRFSRSKKSSAAAADGLPAMEELFEETSATLADRFGLSHPPSLPPILLVPVPQHFDNSGKGALRT